MSDYLGQLAARAHPGPVGVVPLRPTRFEPEAGLAPSDAFGPPVESVPRRAAANPAGTVRARLTAIDALWESAMPAELSPFAATATRSLSPPTAEGDSYSIAQTGIAISDQAADHRAANPVLVEPSRPAAITTSETPRSAHPAASDSPAEQSVPTHLDRSMAKAAVNRSTQIVPTTNEPPGFRARSAGSPSSRIATAPPRPDAPPPIHITIGRVEVRATVQSSNRHAPSPARTGKVSLEEHLTGRSGGGRP